MNYLQDILVGAGIGISMAVLIIVYDILLKKYGRK